jgi:formylglycine-generating enzyme required for sulfatase activity
MLREASRMSIREFAAKLGVSERMISKWEAAGEEIRPRPANQAALDTFLARQSEQVQERFVAVLDRPLASDQDLRITVPETLPLSEETQVRHPVDGALMALVPEGVFLRGERDEPLWLAGFYIDVYPTTNAAYARFVAATGHPPPKHWDGSAPPTQLSEHPVVYVTWKDAAAYARWARKSLPTSEQWEKAARGTRGETYPWGSQRTPAKCNVRESGLRSTTPVDCYASGVSPYGVYDLCGNAWEWLSSETTPNRYELKGGAFTSPFSRCAPGTWNDASDEMLDDDTGFRCATSVEALRELLRD